MPVDPYTIRRAAPEDTEAITSITDAAYSPYIPLIGRKPQPMTADHAKMAAKGSSWLLLAGDLPVGVLELILEADGLLIYSVAVLPAWQGQGLGRRLLDWAEEQARLAARRTIRLYTNERFESNISLYARLGYYETHREPYLGSALVHMAKEL